MPDNSVNAPVQKASPLDKSALRKDASWLAGRLREPSTYAGLALIAGGLGVHLSGDTIHQITALGMDLGGLIAILLPEAK